MDNRNPPSPPENSFVDGDPRLIELDLPAERAYWCKALNVSEEQLIILVQSVGPSAQSVRECLASLRPEQD